MKQTSQIGVIVLINSSKKEMKVNFYAKNQSLTVSIPSNSQYTTDNFVQFCFRGKQLVNIKPYTQFKQSQGTIKQIRDNSVLVQAKGDKKSFKVGLPNKLFKVQSLQNLMPDDTITLYQTEQGSIFYAAKVQKNQSQDQYPNTVSLQRFPLEHMKKQFKYNRQIRKAISQLQIPFQSWRRIRGDGNCYYRAVGISLIQFFCRKTTPNQNFFYFISELQAGFGYFQPVFQTRGFFLAKLNQMYMLKQKNPEKLIELCQEYFQDPAFDQALVETIREVAVNYLLAHQNDDEIISFLERPVDQISRMIMQMGEQAEGIIFYCVAKGFNISIFHYLIQAAGIQVSNFNKGKDKFEVYLSLRPGHYDLLYTKAQNEQDCYDSKQMKFKQPQKAEYNQEALQKYIEHTKYLYENLYFLLKKGSVMPGEFLPGFSKKIKKYWQNFQPIELNKRNGKIVLQEKDLITFTQNQNFSEMVQVMCSYCLEQPSSIKLDCNHHYCATDIQSHLSNCTDQKMVPTPQQEQQYIFFCQICRHRLDFSIVPQILGKNYSFHYNLMLERSKQKRLEDQKNLNNLKQQMKLKNKKVKQQYKGYQSLIKQSQQKKIQQQNHQQNFLRPHQAIKSVQVKLKCNNCQIYGKTTQIQKYSCGCSLCQICYLTSLQQNNDNCFKCGKSLFFAQPKNTSCNTCSKIKRQDQLQPLPCFHMICFDCSINIIQKSMANQQPPKCSKCNTDFDPQKVHQLFGDTRCYIPSCQSVNCMVRQSVIKIKPGLQVCHCCRDNFASNSTNCGCELCQNCFAQILSSQQFLCINCGCLAIDIDLESLMKLDKAPQKEFQCQICINDFTREDMITLDCEHFFCKECTTQHVKTKVEERELKINCMLCQTQVSVFVIQHLLSPKDWDKYNLLIIEKDLGLVECPNCRNRFTTEEVNIHCTCGNNFCVRCSEAAHQGNCDQAKINDLIAKLEAAGQSVAQCPGCKTPYIKDDACQHVKCTLNQCRIEFCFKCSCRRSPTMTHGNHYHRPECPFYAECDDADRAMPNCEECQRLGRLCPKPRRLSNPRKFLEGEE